MKIISKTTSSRVAAIASCVVALTLGIAPQCRAQDAVRDYFANWFVRSDAAKAEQPHWITPLATTTPRLEQEFRYDQFFQAMQHGASTINFGGGKGLELIPWDTIEFILSAPPYLSHEAPGKAGVKGRGSDSFNDWTAPEEESL